ncbi:MAG: VanZ family protein [Candidatus Eisenbacteria sp.]|nr:VanZ family protein [Candidatus Eisenbacteria bacterium]MCK5596229.1 VanZ family protein [Candidatus Eisenbacteria bacterium]
MKRSTELTLRTWILVVAYLALIFGVSSIPQDPLSHTCFKVSDKMAHLAEYAGFGLLLSVASRSTFRRVRRWVLLVVVVLIGAAVGALDETYQMTVPGRERELLDWVADVTGVLVGSCLAMAISSWMARRAAAAGKAA